MLENQIRKLAARKHSSGPVVSLYADTTRSDEGQRDRQRVFLKNEANRIRESLSTSRNQESVENALKQIERYVDDSLRPETRGLAIFAAPEENWFEAIELPVPVRTSVTIGSRPHLRQLMEMRRMYPRIIVALVDAKSGRLFTVDFGKILTEVDLENPEVPRKHDQGGWSQANLQRHMQDHIDRHHKEVADTLTRMVEQHHFERVVLSGQERNVANFRSFLPKRVDERVIGTLHLDIRSSADEVASACQALVDTERHEGIRSKVDTLHENGRSALGLDAVIRAANEKRLESLYVTRAAESSGWKCSSCAIMGVQVPLGCPSCGSSVLTVDVVDELIATAEMDNAAVECVSQSSVLDQHQGIGATLRF